MPDNESPLDWAYGPEAEPSFFDSGVDDLSHGPAMLLRCHPSAMADAVLLDGPIGHESSPPDGDPPALEVCTDSVHGYPLVFSTRREVADFIDLLRAAMLIVWPDPGPPSA